MRIIGIDPGTRTLGWGIIDLLGPGRYSVVAYGAIEPPKKTGAIAERLGFIAEALSLILKEHSPKKAGVEKSFFGKNAAAAFRVGEARGMAFAELTRGGVNVTELTPAEIKKAVTGNGAAKKEQVALMVRAVLGIKEEIHPLDASDALAMAIAVSHKIESEKRTAAFKKHIEK